MKSDVKAYLELAAVVYSDAVAQCAAEVSDVRDLMTIRLRTECEGLSFLTITLPQFARDFEQALAMGGVDSTHFRSFKKCGAIPAFLRGMLSRLFSRETGRLLDETLDSPIYVAAVRQICRLFQKIEMPCTPAREAQAVENFVQVEQSFESFELPRERADNFARVARLLWDNLLVRIRTSEVVPRHGPGATVEGKLGNQKYVHDTWHERLEPFFPFIGFALPVRACGGEDEDPSFGEGPDWLEKVSFLSPDQELPVKVTMVPKTLKGPRVIAIEPVAMQYAQQALRSRIYSEVEADGVVGGHVNFTDQTINQRLALASSRTGQYATIDLSDASDRVPRDLALRIFDSFPDLRDAVDACRSTCALLPDGRFIGPLRKFASMGSALCFPVEALYFYTICVEALLDANNFPYTYATVKAVAADVYVYGDDLIVPTVHAAAVLERLQLYNCKPNLSKTFISGKFRESCGVDAYDGSDVTPTYIRRKVPQNRQQVPELISWIATANLFFQKGYEQTAELMFCTCERLLGKLPQVSQDCEGLGRIVSLPDRRAARYGSRFQRLEKRCWVPSVVYRSDMVDDYPALQKCLLEMEVAVSTPTTPEGASERLESWARGFVPLVRDSRHLERSVLRGAATLKRRWVPVT